MRHFPAYINGKQIDTDRVTYGIDVAALLDPDARSLWRRLLAGDPAVAGHPYVIGSASVVTETLAEEATQAAAQAAPEWAAMPLDHRRKVAPLIRERLLARHRKLAALMMAEGYPRGLAEWQLAAAANALDERSISWYAGQLEQEVTLDRRRLRQVRRPDGVVCVNPPRNAPAINGLLGVHALVAGNTMVVRVPRSVPVSASYLLTEVVAPALDACRAPPGTLNVICGDQPAIMAHWLASPLVDSICYFGTSAHGAAIERRCVEAGKKPILELSGNDGVLVWRDADLDQAVAALGECFLGSGQICMKPGYVLAHPAIADELLARLVVTAGAQHAGHPTTEGVTLSPVLKPDQCRRWLAEAVAAGATVVCGGRRIDADHLPAEHGLFVEATVLRIDGLAAAAGHRVVREEAFFPLLPVVVPEPEPDRELLAEMIRFLNGNRYGLRNSLWAGDPAVVDEFLRRVTNGGNLRVNDSHLGCPRLLPTHGGAGRSGGVWGDASHLALRTSRQQAISIGPGDEPPAWSRTQIWP